MRVLLPVVILYSCQQEFKNFYECETQPYIPQTLKGGIICHRMVYFLFFLVFKHLRQLVRYFLMTITMTFLLLTALLFLTYYKKVMALQSFVSFQYYQHRMDSLVSYVEGVSVSKGNLIPPYSALLTRRHPMQPSTFPAQM